MMHNDWNIVTNPPIYSPEWPQLEGTGPTAPVLLGYWHNAQFVVDLATGDVWYRVQHQPIWMHYSSVATWLETRAGRDYLRAMQTSCPAAALGYGNGNVLACPSTLHDQASKSQT